MDHPLQAMEERLKPGLRLRVLFEEYLDICMFGCAVLDESGQEVANHLLHCSRLALTFSRNNFDRIMWGRLEREMMTALPYLFTESGSGVLD